MSTNNKKRFPVLEVIMAILLLFSIGYHFWPEIADPVPTPQVISFACTTDLGPDEYELRLIDEWGNEQVERHNLGAGHPFASYGPASGRYYMGITTGANITANHLVQFGGLVVNMCPTTRWMDVTFDNTSHIDFHFTPQYQP